jgi:hypothetical protein
MTWLFLDSVLRGEAEDTEVQDEVSSKKYGAN